jgi:hypothetical protein
MPSGVYGNDQSLCRHYYGNEQRGLKIVYYGHGQMDLNSHYYGRDHMGIYAFLWVWAEGSI